MIEVNSHKLNVEDQTYSISCGTEDGYPVGNKVRVRLEGSDKTLEISEIGVNGCWQSGKCVELDNLL